MINFLNTRYVFRHNQVMGYTEYRPNNTWVVDWQACDEKAINGLTIDARLSGLDVRDNDVRRYVRSNMIRAFDPVGDFMMRVADRWDGQTDHIAMLARCIPCDPGSRCSSWLIRRTLPSLGCRRSSCCCLHFDWLQRKRQQN